MGTSRSLLVSLALLGVLAGCGGQTPREGSAGTPGTSGTAGSAGAGGGTGSGGSAGAVTELEVRPLLFSPPDAPALLLGAGDDAPLEPAPQGGHVLMVGARIRGLGGDTIEISARLRHPTDRRILNEERRTVVVRPAPDEPGWADTDRRTNSQFAHVALCPNFGPRSIHDERWLLEVGVVELYAEFTEGRAEVEVVLRCPEHEPWRGLCRCECAAGYVLGQPCP